MSWGLEPVATQVVSEVAESSPCQINVRHGVPGKAIQGQSEQSAIDCSGGGKNLSGFNGFYGTRDKGQAGCCEL